jgi:lipopolysaccharide/colanic/teichoic acid biosynthesis glycosyltransferase
MEGRLVLIRLVTRLLDILAVLVLATPLVPVIVVVAIAILVTDGRPVFYISERMKTPTKGFQLVKFRTMRTVAVDSGVSGADKLSRITPIGTFLRRTRLDELPQLWNILKGDMAFVGPRPPLRRYVEDYPQIYSAVLRSRPGVTGLATLVYHRHEQRLLAASRSAEETDAIYRRACVPRKARLDLIHQAHQNPCYDFSLMLRTVFGKKRKRSKG